MIISNWVIVIHIFRVFAKFYGGHLEIGSAEVVQTKIFPINIRICLKIFRDQKMLVSLSCGGGRCEDPTWSMD